MRAYLKCEKAKTEIGLIRNAKAFNKKISTQEWT
jgi:hypothetical protein